MSSRNEFSFKNPYRTIRPSTSKIIFLSMEGCVTEEMYFKRITELFPEVGSKIQFISVAEDVVNTPEYLRTTEQQRIISKTRPKQLLERIETFKEKNNLQYEFDLHTDDEFWIVSDVDQNWSNAVINKNNESYRDEWLYTVSECERKHYGYAISNPFFEVWLLLHHDEINDEDKTYAVTDTNPYAKTNHFANRLKELGVPMRHKEINRAHYTRENVKEAVERAKELHKDKDDLYPKYLASTVYRLIEKIMELLPTQNEELA